MVRGSYFSVAAASLIASSTPAVQGIGLWPPPPLVEVTEVDITRLDSAMLNSAAYSPSVTMRVCYTEIAELRDFGYTDPTHFYRLKACEVPSVITPKCSTAQLATCTPAFYTLTMSKLAIINIHEDGDQSESGITNWIQGGNESTARGITAPPTEVPTPSPSTTDSAVKARASEAPTSTPTQSDALSFGAGCFTLFATLVATFVAV